MKLCIASTIFALLSLLLPCSIISQTSSQSVRIPKEKNHRRSVTNSKMAISSNEQSQVKKIVERFITEVFEKRDTIGAFENLVSFEKCNVSDEEFIGQDCWLNNIQSRLGRRTYSRIPVASWKSEYECLFLALGTDLIGKTKSMECNSADYHAIEAMVLEKNNSSMVNFGTLELSNNEIEKQLDEIEKNFADIENLIFGRIDKEIYQRNLITMAKSLKVKKEIAGKRKYYGVNIDGTNMGVVISKKNGKLRIINIVQITYQ
jgi:hypothetical protein